ncbi:hypothetical protein E0Z10_g14 [Xylaria hypoxylon]|uniref:F-box domain-containing protein n=1 Tax=Xylaria hypoxylon TaxID=37992 RepID=A0A4Z0YWB3_9PEZI|nr:hypothetical protein E0Z10_g14 [Xylaria hypoxylon]
MASSTSPDALATNLARAKAYYNDKQYPKATALFKQVANSCACGVQARTSPCCCKSLTLAIANGTFEAELRKKCICSAKSDVRCKSASHLDALDGLAAVYEAKRPLDKTIVIAEAMINLAPREPKAHQTYQQGIELVSKKNPSHQLLPILHQMRDKVKYPAVATDPLPILPLELVGMIFKNIDFRSVCRCLGVSKSWRNLLTTRDATIQSLWRIQHFDYCTKASVRPDLQRYATYSGSQVAELIIRDCRQFRIDSNTFRWIASCRSLQVLQLRASRETDLSLAGGINNPCRPQLTRLYLGLYAPFMLEFVHKIVASSAATLQELTILNFPSNPTKRVRDAEIANWPVLQRLRVLHLGCAPHRQGVFNNQTVLNIPSFMRTSPNLEELWLEGVVEDQTECPSDAWPRLKRLFLGHAVVWHWKGGAPLLPLSEIEELHVMDQSLIYNFLRAPFTENPHPEPKKLRKFTIRDHIKDWPQYLQRWVRPSLESGSLKELGLVFPKPHPYWLKSDQLTFLSLKGISVEFGSDPFALDEVLSDLLERFPNLEGLDISQEPFSDAALARAIQKGVKVIYHRGEYHKKIDVRAWALKNHNARIIEGDYITNLPMYPEERYKEFY